MNMTKKDVAEQYYYCVVSRYSTAGELTTNEVAKGWQHWGGELGKGIKDGGKGIGDGIKYGCVVLAAATVTVTLINRTSKQSKRD